MSKRRRGWEEVNRQEGAIPFDASVVCGELGLASVNPIDEFYDHATKLVERSAREGYWQDELIPRLLLLDLVSSSEQYFRRVLGLLVGVCPICALAAGSQNLSLFAVDYYDRDQLGIALLDSSLAAADGVRKQTKKLTDIEIRRGSSVDAALEEYDRVCHLRHAAVHSRGELGPRNVQKLGLDASKRLCLDLSAVQFQVLLAVCQNAVRAYNRFLFKTVLSRWDVRRVLQRTWSNDRALFAALHQLFVSRRDGTAPTSPYNAYRGFLSRKGDAL